MTEYAIQPRRSLLYLPGARPEMYPKALKSGTDIVCVDLEDAVSADVKDETRANVFALFAEPYDSNVERLIRLNGVETDAGKADLEALSQAEIPLDGVVIPKCADPDHVTMVEDAAWSRHPDLRIHPLIESAQGAEAAFDIAAASPRVGFIMLGSQDMATSLRADHAWEPLLYTRSRLVAAAAAHGKDVLDAPYFDIGDLDGLADETEKVRALGFVGKSAIHPKQIETINGIFSPNADEVDRARNLVAKFEGQDLAAVMIDGEFMEPPIIARLKRIIAIADRIGL